MFQNISGEVETNEFEDVEISKRKDIKKIFEKVGIWQNILLYIVSFLLSMVNIGGGMSPLGLAMLAAIVSNEIPVGIMYVVTLIGTLLAFQTEGLLTYILTTLIFFAMILIFKSKTGIEQGNEKRRVGLFVFLSAFLVQAGGIFFEGFLVYDLLVSFSVRYNSFYIL